MCPIYYLVSLYLLAYFLSFLFLFLISCGNNSHTIRAKFKGWVANNYVTVLMLHK